MQSIKEFYDSRDAAGIPKHNTHDIAEFEVNTTYYYVYLCSFCPVVFSQTELTSI